MSRIKSNPRRSKHEVNMSFISVAPILENLFKIELADNFMCGKHGIHVGSKSKISVNASLIKFNLDETVRIGAYNKVHFSPVDHYNLFDIVHDVRKLLLGDSFHASVHLSRFKLTS